MIVFRKSISLLFITVLFVSCNALKTSKTSCTYNSVTHTDISTSAQFEKQTSLKITEVVLPLPMTRACTLLTLMVRILTNLSKFGHKVKHNRALFGFLPLMHPTNG